MEIFQASHRNSLDVSPADAEAVLCLVTAADIATGDASMAKNKHWNDMTSPLVDYGHTKM